MSLVSGRNGSRLRRNLRKGKKPEGMSFTEALMNTYGNKRKAQVAQLVADAKRAKKGR